MLPWLHLTIFVSLPTRFKSNFFVALELLWNAFHHLFDESFLSRLQIFAVSFISSFQYPH